MKNKFIRKWLVILTVAAMMIPAGIPANAETVEEGENIAPTAGISAETPNVTYVYESGNIQYCRKRKD